MKASFQKSLLFLGISFFVLVTSWDLGQNHAVLAQAIGETEAPAIPQESIRLRILADSDAPADQALKRRIRDEVIAMMNEWVDGPQSIEAARETVQLHLPEIQQAAERLAVTSGFNGPVQVELGVVPFPTKVYGGQLYPAGDYEAVRITIGRGLGQNWWCVLFPPLCFVDVAAGERPAETGEVRETSTADEEERPKVEYRFFLAEWVADIAGSVRAWFA